MHILVISPWLPHSNILHAGGQTLYQRVKRLADEHTLHLLCYGRNESHEHIKTISEFCETVTILYPSYSWSDKVTQFVKRWHSPRTWGRRVHTEARQIIKQLCDDFPIKLAYLVWTEMGRYLDAIPPNVATVLNTFDVEFRVRPLEVALHPNRIARAIACMRARQLIRGERNHVNLADAVAASSKSDGYYLQQLQVKDSIIVVSPWIGEDSLQEIDACTYVFGRLTFMGALDRIANVAAAKYLLENVWPTVRQAAPYTTLHIVGAHPPKELQKYSCNDRRVHITGYVPHLGAVWEQTDIAVAPSLIGGGLVTKVAQPMLAGCPVITTSLGNEGVNAIPDIEVKVADNPADFSDAILHMLDDRKYRGRVARSGRSHVLESLNWDASCDHLKETFDLALTLCNARQES